MSDIQLNFCIFSLHSAVSSEANACVFGKYPIGKLLTLAAPRGNVNFR